MKAACWGVVRAALAALLVAVTTHVVVASPTVKYSKFLMFFELLDQSGTIAGEFAAADGDLCQVQGVGCEGGEVVTMCVLLHSATISTLVGMLWA